MSNMRVEFSSTGTAKDPGRPNLPLLHLYLSEEDYEEYLNAPAEEMIAEEESLGTESTPASYSNNGYRRKPKK